MYFATTANGRSETKVDEVKLAVAPCGSSEKNCWGWGGVSTTNKANITSGNTFTEPILRYGLYTKHMTSRTAAKIGLIPTTTSESVFEEVSKSSTDQLCCSLSSLDGGYTDTCTEVGELRDIHCTCTCRIVFNLSPKWTKSRRKWRSRRKVWCKST